MSTTTPAWKHSASLDSMLLYKVQGSDVSVHAMLEYVQQANITYEMPAHYKLTLSWETLALPGQRRLFVISVLYTVLCT